MSHISTGKVSDEWFASGHELRPAIHSPYPTQYLSGTKRDSGKNWIRNLSICFWAQVKRSAHQTKMRQLGCCRVRKIGGSRPDFLYRQILDGFHFNGGRFGRIWRVSPNSSGGNLWPAGSRLKDTSGFPLPADSRRISLQWWSIWTDLEDLSENSNTNNKIKHTKQNRHHTSNPPDLHVLTSNI